MLLFSVPVFPWSCLFCPFRKSQHLHHHQVQTEIQSSHQLLAHAKGKLNYYDQTKSLHSMVGSVLVHMYIQIKPGGGGLSPDALIYARGRPEQKVEQSVGGCVVVFHYLGAIGLLQRWLLFQAGIHGALKRWPVVPTFWVVAAGLIILLTQMIPMGTTEWD